MECRLPLSESTAIPVLYALYVRDFCGAMILGAILFLFRSYNPPDAQARHRRGDDPGADEAGTAFVGVFAAEERSVEVDER